MSLGTPDNSAIQKLSIIIIIIIIMTNHELFLCPHRVGLLGAVGVGKSTLIKQFLAFDEQAESNHSSKTFV